MNTLPSAAELKSIAINHWLSLIIPLLQHAATEGYFSYTYHPPFLTQAQVLRKVLPADVITELEDAGYTVENRDQSYRISW